MKSLTLRAFALDIPFTQTFRHAAAERTCTQSVWVEADDGAGHRGYGEACPREYVTGESQSSALATIEAGAPAWCANIHDVAALRAWVHEHRASIDLNPAAWCAVELALLDLFARREAISVEELLGLEPLSGEFSYTAVLGDSPPEVFETMLARYVATGFEQYKIKLGGRSAHDRAKVAALRAAGIAPMQVRADANNLFRSARDAVRYLDHLDFPFGALEEPVEARDLEGLCAVARACDCAIVLDESLTRAEEVKALPAGIPWIVNVRVSKMGGLLRSIATADAAARCGYGVIVGAHVGETSLLSRAALTVAHRCRDSLLGQEGAFGLHLLQHDVVPDSLVFGAGGRLAARAVPRGPGSGFERVTVPTVHAVSPAAPGGGHLPAYD
jgi:L-alanine-DL-glutamate epimerase-like enolase superfamily enzyme